MLPTNRTKKSCKYKALFFLAANSTLTTILLLSSSTAVAYEWILSPSMTTQLIYTDNITLAPKGDPGRRDDFVTRLAPGIYSKFTSRRFDSEINYVLNNQIYARESERNRSLHNLDARNTLEAIEDFFFIDGNARIQQQNQSILEPQGDDISLTGNLRNVRQFTVSPYIQNRFGNFANSELRYAWIHSESDATSTFLNSQANQYTGSIISGSDFRTLQWGLNYTRQDVDYDLRPDTVRIESSIANIRYNLTRQFAITGTGGYENNNFGSGLGVIQTKAKGARWSAGFIWIPNERTNIEASFGQRFFGDTYRGIFNHRNRLMAMNASYVEEINSSFTILDTGVSGNTVAVLTALFTGQAPPGTDPAFIAQLVNLFITELGLPPSLAFAQGFLTNRFFLQKSFESSVGFNFSKNTLLFRAFHTSRVPLDNIPRIDSIVGVTIGNAHVRQTGANVLWSYAFSPRTRVSANAQYNHLYFPTLFRVDNIKTFTFSVSREFTENIFGFLSYIRRDRRSDDPSQEYVENRATASISMRF